MKPELVIAGCAVFVSLVSLGTSIYFSWCTRDHNKRSVRPRPYVLPSDFENQMSVRLWNNGLGPLILRKVLALHEKKGSEGHLIDLIPSPPEDLYFNNFAKVRCGRTILAGQSLDLLDLGVDENNANAVSYRDQLRDFLGHVVVLIEYTDIYESTFPIHKQDLAWFHRDSEELLENT